MKIFFSAFQSIIKQTCFFAVFIFQDFVQLLEKGHL